MDMDIGFFSWIISADISVPENFMDMDMDMPNFHGSYPWRALVLACCHGITRSLDLVGGLILGLT